MDLEQIGLDAVDTFITTWNSRDPDAWAGSLNYPHVRPSARAPFRVADTLESYAAGVDYERVIATGWDHSEWDWRHVLATSRNKIHIAGQWSRYTAAGEKFVTNPVLYVATLVDGHWGIQARFAADFRDDDDTSGVEARAFSVVDDWMVKINTGQRAAAASLYHYPFVTVEPGHLAVTDAASELDPALHQVDVLGAVAVHTGRISTNLSLDLAVTDAAGDTRHMNGAMLLTERDGHLGITALSLLDPTDNGD